MPAMNRSALAALALGMATLIPTPNSPDRSRVNPRLRRRGNASPAPTIGTKGPARQPKARKKGRRHREHRA